MFSDRHLERHGYTVTLTPQTRDGGKDMYAARRDDVGSFLYVVASGHLLLIDGNQFWPRSFISLSAARSWEMRAPPSIVPGMDRHVYLVLDDFGRMGCAWRETNVADTELEAVIDDSLEGQYSNPIRVIGLNVSEGWVRDVSCAKVAPALRQ